MLPGHWSPQKPRRLILDKSATGVIDSLAGFDDSAVFDQKAAIDRQAVIDQVIVSSAVGLDRPG